MMKGFGLLAALALPVVPAAAQDRSIDPVAKAFIEKSITAHSAAPAKLRLSFRGTTTGPDQGRYPDGPATPHPWSIDIALDESAGQFALNASLGLDGGFIFPRRIGFAGGRGYATRYTGDYDPISDMPAEANGQLPHLLLRSVLKNAESLRLLPDPALTSIAYNLPGGPTTVLQFDKRSRLLVSQRRRPVATSFGDRLLDIAYGPYRRVGRTMVPEAITLQFRSPALGPFAYSLALTAASVGGPTAAELAMPPGKLRPVAPPTFSLERFGDKAVLLRNVATEGQFSYNVLAVPFADHVLVVEAALNDATTRKVMEEVGRLFPGKPIRTLVQTHHHGDHIGGIRTYIVTGTTILTPAGTRAFIDRMAGAHSAVAPDSLAAAPKPAVVEEVAADRTIQDSFNEVRLLTFPNDHSGTMLMVYLPAWKLLYQGDLISADELPLFDTSRAFLNWLSKSGLEIETVAGLHGRTVAGQELRDLVRQASVTGSGR